jgi:hypothetical protein
MSKPCVEIEHMIMNSIQNGENSFDDILTLKKQHDLDIIEILDSISQLELFELITGINDKFIISKS